MGLAAASAAACHFRVEYCASVGGVEDTAAPGDRGAGMKNTYYGGP